MIRHKRSFFISLSVHALLFFSIYFAWSTVSKTQKTDLEHKICVELCRVEQEEKSIESQPKIKPQPKQKPKPKQKPEPKPKKEQTPPKPIQEVVKDIIPEITEIPQSKPDTTIVKAEKTVSVSEEIIESKEVSVHVAQKPQKENVKQEQDNIKDKYIKLNTQKISALIRDNLYYPMAARKRNITGRVSIKFTLGVDAKVYNIKIVDSSSDILSRAAIKTIEELSGKFPKPKQEITLSLPIDYSLN